MLAKYFFSGVFVKLITGFDDTLVHIPIMTNVAKTRKGRFAFSLGIFLAVSLAILVSFLFASVLRSIPYYRYISSGLIFLLAIFVYVSPFSAKNKTKLRRRISKTQKTPAKRIFQLVGLGFITAFATVIDDTLAYSSLLVQKYSAIPVISGILYATILELFIIVSFSTKLQKIKYKKEITTLGLLILSLFILLGVL